jgi:adsorption protein B
VLHFASTQLIPVWLDRAILAMLAPLALAILISGLDDLVIDVAWAASWIQRKLRPAPELWPPGPRQLDLAPRLSIAIMIPLWQEHDVISRMLAHNLASIRYSEYHIFAGTYPNDDRTQDAVREIADHHANVHLTVCPHDGPTSKADCLNWIYQHIGLYEAQNGFRFDVILIHDAEDVIHPDELHWLNYYAARYDFIQTPVFALRTPVEELVHGIYCDEFAEYHTRDMPVRPLLGGFVPSAGVGTAYRRDALERLAARRANRVFEPEALTEDYENGLMLFRLGCSQAFVPPVRVAEGFVATREYFPQNWRAALRQRTRWVMGITLQSWERFGWGRNPGETYWLWRDRKGLIASPLGFLANLIFVYGILTRMWTRATPLASHIVIMMAILAAIRLGVRMGCSGRVYGFAFALAVPIRAICANVLNAAATARAVYRYAAARAQRRPLVWLKTDHAFPSVSESKRKLGEILTGSGFVSAAIVQSALASKPKDMRVGEHLVRIGAIDEESMYQALSLQQGLPLVDLDLRTIPMRIARAIPRDAIERWRVLPFRVAGHSIFLATPEVPSTRLSASLREFTAMELRFHLVTPARFERLRRALVDNPAR